MKVEVREARVNDANAIAEIYTASWKSTYADILPESLLNSLSVESLSKEWTGKIERGDSSIYVAESKGEIIGFAELGSNEDEDLKNEKLDIVELHALYFHPSTVNQGLGTQMWGVLEEQLIGKLVVLWVLRDSSDARHFYIKHGFEQDLVEGQLQFQDQSFPRKRYRKLIC